VSFKSHVGIPVFCLIALLLPASALVDEAVITRVLADEADRIVVEFHFDNYARETVRIGDEVLGL